MDILKEIQGSNTLKPLDIEKFKDGEIISYCDNCGEPNGICKILMGRKYACKISCKCSFEKLLQQKAAEDLEERKFILNKYFGDISDNKTYKHCTFENWKFDKVSKEKYNIFHSYAKNFKENLKNNVGILAGGPAGNGKTYAAACVVNEIEKMGYIGLIVQLPKLIEKADTYKNEGLTSFRVYKKLRYADLIILDDFGIERNFDKEKIYGIVNELYTANKNVIITTNLTVEEINKYHSRIRSRLNSMVPIMATFEENNLRMVEGKAKRSLFNSLINKFKN